MKIECVGVPPYPNHTYPRVVGLLRPPKQSGAGLPSITYLKGDASEPRGAGIRLVVQVVNDAALTWGGGFSLMLRKKWPTLQQAFRSWAPQLAQQQLRIPNPGLQPLFQVVRKLLQPARTLGTGPIPRLASGHQVLPDGLAVIARKAADRLDAQTLSLQLVYLVHVFPP